MDREMEEKTQGPDLTALISIKWQGTPERMAKQEKNLEAILEMYVIIRRCLTVALFICCI